MQNCTNYYKAILENKVEYDMKEQNNIEGTGDKTSLKCKGVSISLNCGTSAVKPPVAHRPTLTAVSTRVTFPHSLLPVHQMNQTHLDYAHLTENLFPEFPLLPLWTGTSRIRFSAQYWPKMKNAAWLTPHTPAHIVLQINSSQERRRVN